MNKKNEQNSSIPTFLIKMKKIYHDKCKDNFLLRVHLASSKKNNFLFCSFAKYITTNASILIRRNDKKNKA